MSAERRSDSPAPTCAPYPSGTGSGAKIAAIAASARLIGAKAASIGTTVACPSLLPVMAYQGPRPPGQGIVAPATETTPRVAPGS